MKINLTTIARLARSMSARLLVLTAIFVLLGEVLIYVPSIARHRLVFLEERIAASRLAALAVEAAPDQMVTEQLSAALLSRAGVSAISLKRPGQRLLVLSEPMPDEVHAAFDLMEATPYTLIIDAFDALLHGGERTIRVTGHVPDDEPETVVDIVLPEASLHAAMLDYSGRILALSLVLALVVAFLVYLSLHFLMVRPMGRITDSLVSFRRDPEDASAVVQVTRRGDEVGLAQRELAVMQRRVRAALRQKARLADVGSAVSKINHDLRNMLATAALLTDRLAMASDPEVQKLAAPLVSAIDRAINLCTQTLSFAKAGEPDPKPARFALAPLVAEVRAAMPLADDTAIIWRNDVPEEIELVADRDQVYRIVMNLTRNAVEAIDRHTGGGTVRVNAWRDADATVVEVADTGPGLPEEAREHLFEAFAGAGRSDSTGLGLTIARDLVRGHGGEITLERSDPTGTVFRLRFPDSLEGDNGR